MGKLHTSQARRYLDCKREGFSTSSRHPRGINGYLIHREQSRSDGSTDSNGVCCPVLLPLVSTVSFFRSLQGTSASLASSKQPFLFRRPRFSDTRKVDSGTEVGLFSSSEQSFLLSVVCMDFLKLPELVTFGSS